MIRSAATLFLVVGLMAVPGLPAEDPPASCAGLEWPGGERPELRLSGDLWEEVLSRVNNAGRALGYTSEQMSHYGRDLHRLRTVEGLFRDVTAIPRLGGRYARTLVASATDPARVVQRGYLLTDISAGRRLPVAEEGWWVDWIEEEATPTRALEAVRARLAEVPAPPRLRPREQAAWEQLPETVRRLTVRLLIGAAEATPWLEAGLPAAFLREAATGSPTADPSIEQLYRLATAPWEDDRLGQLATRSAASFEALDRVDRTYLAFGSVIYLTHAHRALEEFREAGGVGAVPESFEGFGFDTPAGAVRVAGTGADTHEEPAFLLVDLGGDDTWKGRHAVPAWPRRLVAAAVDLGGDDTWQGGEEPVALGCGLFGLGVLADLEGDDTYAIAESGLGAAWYGTGIVMDYAGDDRYAVQGRWGQGAAHAGVGALVDLSGDDRYECGSQSQGMGSTLGAGILLDVNGNDRYVARDDGNVSELYLNQSVAMSQGVGYGRRADLGDGHSLAGGFGLLVDGAGNDDYHAQVWAQGAGYWWGVGILEDLGGDDAYRNGKYSSGAGAHFAIGVHTDLSGNDRYNQGNDTAVNQYQGHARDGSIGIFHDGDGDDRYFFKRHCGGSGDLASVGLFWDRRGDDHYEVDYEAPEDPSGWNDTPPMGTTTMYQPFHSFRDDLDAVGLFLDTGGADRYAWEGGPAVEDSGWSTIRGPRGWGYGMDGECYPPAEEEETP